MLQSVPRRPSQHVQVNAAMFGKLIFEGDQLDEKGRPAADAHTWLHMLETDIKVLSQIIDEGASLYEYNSARAGILTLMHDFEAREMFLCIDPAQLRAK